MAVVRVIQASDKPALPPAPRKPLRQIKTAFARTIDFALGSSTGLVAGLAIVLMLKLMGFNFNGLEIGLIIGLPAVVGMVTSLITC